MAELVDTFCLNCVVITEFSPSTLVRLVSQLNQKLFRVGLSERERESPERLERWIDMVKVEKSNNIKRHQALMKKHREITYYFRLVIKLQVITEEETKN